MSPTYDSCDPQVSHVLDHLLAAFQAILAEKLVGVYLYGSLTVGDFDPMISDIDLLVVTTSPLDDPEFDALHQMHQRLATEQPAREDRIEVAYLTTQALQTFRTHVSEIAIISPGEPFHRKDAGKDWLVNWYMVREKGETLFGPPPQEIIPPIAQTEFVETIRDHTRAWAQWVDDCYQLGSQAYAIFTLCRALYTDRYGEQLSKLQAARWAEQEYPQWASLIQDAQLWRQHTAIGAPPLAIDPATTFPATVRFVHFAIEEVAHR